MENIEVLKMMVSPSKYGKKCPYSMNPTRIVVHNTYNDASAKSEISYMINNNFSTSFHYAIDDKQVVQGIPTDRNAWHSGDGRGKGNMEGIGIEICYSLSGGERFDKAEDLSARFIAYLLKQRGWGIEKVTKHQDYSGKYCPHRTLDMGWDRFLDKVRHYLNDEYQLKRGEYTVLASDNSNKGIFTNKEEAIKLANKYQGRVLDSEDNEVYKVEEKKKAYVKPTAVNYSTGQKISEWVKGNTYKIRILDTKYNRALLDEINSWVNLDDIDLV